MTTLIDRENARYADIQQGLTTPQSEIREILTKIITENDHLKMTDMNVSTTYPCCPNDSPSDLIASFTIHYANEGETPDSDNEHKGLTVITGLPFLQEVLTLLQKEFG